MQICFVFHQNDSAYNKLITYGSHYIDVDTLKCWIAKKETPNKNYGAALCI